MGRQSLGQWVSRSACHREWRAEQRKQMASLSRLQGTQLCSVNFVMVIVVHRVQVTDVEGDSRPGRNESWERKEMSPTHRGKHNRRPA